MDHASNRYLAPQPVPGEGAFLTFNADLTRTTPTLQLDLQPFLLLDRFTDASGSDSSNGSLNASATWEHERSTLTLTGGYSDLSTLITEIASTGAVQGNSHQRQSTFGGQWSFQESDIAQLNVAAGYADVRYEGQVVAGLSNYTYPTYSLGEQFKLAPRTSLSITASGSELSSPAGGGTSRETQLELSAEHTFSERLSGSIAAGVSNLNYGTGSNHGAVGEAALTRTGEVSRWKIDYQRSVSPNGYGELVVRDQGSITATRDFTARLSANASVFATRDREVYFFVFQLSRSYETAEVDLNWKSGETSTIGLRLADDRAHVQTFIPIPQQNGFRVGLAYTWTPQVRHFSR